MPEVLEQDDVRSLCKHLSGHDKVPVCDLPKALQSPSTLAKAVAKGLALVGRRNTTDVITEIRPKKNKDGTHVLDENFNHVVDRVIERRIDNDFNWTNLKGNAHKTMAEILDEDRSLKKEDLSTLGLHVKLTTEGLAAS